MVSFREVAVDDPAAALLLTDYFASRAAGFPGGKAAYHVAFPAPAQFVPPLGVFLLVEDPVIALKSGAISSTVNVGCGGIRRIDSPSGIRFEVKHLWLEPATRGRGFGRALLGELEARARSFGGTELVLDTNASLTAAGGLYRSAGFSSIEPYNDNPNATDWFGKPL